MNIFKHKRFLHAAFGLLAVGLLLIFASPSVSEENPADDKEQEIIVIGSSRIWEGNVAQARKAAISDALVKGMEGYLTKLLGSQGMVNNFQRIIEDIIPNANDEIENYHILTEQQGDKYFKILVRVKVNQAMMEEKLRETGLVLLKGAPVKVLFMVSEEDKKMERISYWWSDPEVAAGLTNTELALHRVFTEYGLKPINRVLTFPEENYSDEMRKMDLSDEDIINWGKIFSADIVIYGMCTVLEEESIFLDLRSYNAAGGTMIYQDSQVATIDAETEGDSKLMQSIERAANIIALKMVPVSIRAFNMNQNVISSMDIELSGLKSFEQFRRLRDFLLNEIGGVNSVIQTHIKANAITVKVEYTGTQDRFIESILNNENFPYLAEIIKNEEGGIKIQIKWER